MVLAVPYTRCCLPFPGRARQSTPGAPLHSIPAVAATRLIIVRTHMARSGIHSRALACMHVRAHATLARRAGGQACQARYIKYLGMHLHAFVYKDIVVFSRRAEQRLGDLLSHSRQLANCCSHAVVLGAMGCLQR